LWLKKRAGRLHTDCTAPTIYKNQTGDILQYFQDGNRRFLSFTDRKYLMEYPLRGISLYEAEAWLPSNGLKFHTDGSLFEARAGSFALGTFTTVVHAEVCAILTCSDYCFRECMTGKTIYICSDRRVALLCVISVIKAGASIYS
jgi:hypothetical protein